MSAAGAWRRGTAAMLGVALLGPSSVLAQQQNAGARCRFARPPSFIFGGESHKCSGV